MTSGAHAAHCVFTTEGGRNVGEGEGVGGGVAEPVAEPLAEGAGECDMVGVTDGVREGVGVAEVPTSG